MGYYEDEIATGVVLALFVPLIISSGGNSGSQAATLWSTLAIGCGNHFWTLVEIVLWGTISGSMIPILLKNLKRDPATSSAPFVATLVDVTSLIIYFTVAAIILRGTLL